MMRPNVRQQRNGPRRLMSITRRHSAAVMSSAGAMELMAALLTSTSIRLYLVITESAMRATAVSSETSPRTSMTSTPRLRTWAVVSVGERRSLRASENPRWARTSAVRPPIPWAAPVTRATFMNGALGMEYSGLDRNETFRPMVFVQFVPFRNETFGEIHESGLALQTFDGGLDVLFCSVDSN